VSRLLLDANLSPALAQALRWRGHDAVHVNDVGLGHAPDPVIFKAAGAARRAVVTHDSDFLQLLAAQPGGPAVVHLSQRELQHNPVVGRLAQAIRLSEVLQELGDRLTPGLGVKVSAVAVRVERSPKAREHEARDHTRGVAPGAGPKLRPTRERGRQR
jgi:predicted nuclease of predicted toxin-antitoxin system